MTNKFVRTSNWHYSVIDTGLHIIFMFDIPLLTWVIVSCTTLNGIKYVSISILYVDTFPKILSQKF